MYRIVAVLMICLLGVATAVRAAPGYEEQLVTRLVETRNDGGVVWLGSARQPFLALYEETADGKGERAAIILHSMGTHADWPELIAPLRRQLPARGWATLSVQMPVLAPEQAPADYGMTLDRARTRVRLAVRYLRNRGYRDIVLIGYSFGATVAVHYLTTETTQVRALVGISMQEHQFLKPAYDLVESLSRVAVPILDIYGGRDFSDVTRSADDRRLAGVRGTRTVYEQLVLRSANHYFTDNEAELLDQVAAWLDQMIPATNESTGD